MPIPDFVTDLRRHVGTELLWLSGVSAVVFDDADRILLGRRSDTGRWAVISGILDPGEQPALAAVREVAEETGVSARVEALTSVHTGAALTYPNGDRAQYLDLTFWCRYTGGEARVADDESLEVGWFAVDALPEPLADSSVQRIADTLAFRADPCAGPAFER
jgi:8-oxo-dGTP pyrophosphatase MutT (NUDIX family)